MFPFVFIYSGQSNHWHVVREVLFLFDRTSPAFLTVLLLRGQVLLELNLFSSLNRVLNELCI